MKPFLIKILSQTTLKKKGSEREKFSDQELERGLAELKIIGKRSIKDFIFVLLGIFSASLGLKGFLLPNNFIDGGATGISLLIQATSNVPLHVLLPLINIPFVILGYKVMGKNFAVKTALAIAGLSVFLSLVQFPIVTQDKLLIAFFGGFFLGAGIGFAVRGGAVIDGTEILAIYLGRKLRMTIGDLVLIINVIIFSLGAYLLGIEVALYSMITYFAASKTLDFLIDGIDEYMGVTIISKKSEQIREMITQKLGRGVTVYSGKGGFGKRGNSEDLEIIYTVITRLELNKLESEIELIEPTAFVVMSSVKDTKGGMIKKKPLKH